MTAPEEKDSLEDRIATLRASAEDTGGQKRRKRPFFPPQVRKLWRVGIDFVAGLITGVVLGLVCDFWLKTAPWGLILFFLIGAAAGLRNVMKAVAPQDESQYKDNQSS